jgi:hypothetical protein
MNAISLIISHKETQYIKIKTNVMESAQMHNQSIYMHE